MTFDKAKAMRNAEKHVAQGKLRAAIGEYKLVVENDPRDVATLNMLGDLHAKNAERREAVECYLKVAEHYSTQGFSQKAIAVYNKIARLQPDSVEVSTKLAELHRAKGSINEARSHYETLATHYEKNGRRIEALSMWKQIALLDPNNTEVCMNLADSYNREGQRDEAADAYAEAGARYARNGKHEESIRAFMKSLDIRSTDVKALDGLVKAYSALGRVNKAVDLLEEILENEPYNRDLLYLLIECHIESQNAAGAERAVTRLVELEPANYPRLLDLIRIYLNSGDIISASRILTMASEYLFAAGQGDEYRKWITEILDRDPHHLPALRLHVRYFSWLKDEVGKLAALDRLAVAARMFDSVEDERYALSRLVGLRPRDTELAERLNELNKLYGASAEIIDAEPEGPAVEGLETHGAYRDFNQEKEESPIFSSNGNGYHAEFEAAEIDESPAEEEVAAEAVEMSPEDLRLAKEIDSIKFYIENEYFDLAVKAIVDLEREFGTRNEISAIRKVLETAQGSAETDSDTEVAVEAEAIAEVDAKPIGLEEIRSEFGLDEPAGEDSDFETMFQTGVAYQEMGLLEEAIRHYQDAVALVQPNDGTRRFYRSTIMLGHCFSESGRPKLAASWYEKALAVNDLTDDERHGLWYEYAVALDANGQDKAAAEYFERIYAENVDFRDVAERTRHPEAAVV